MKRTAALNITLYLLAEIFDGAEFLLRSYILEKFNLHGLPVDILLKIQEVNFKHALSLSALNRRPYA